MFCSPCEEGNSFALVSVGGMETDVLCIEKILQLLIIRSRKSFESPEIIFLQYTDLFHRIYIVDEKLGCVCLRCATNGSVDHSLGKVTCSLEHRHLRLSQWFAMKRLHTLQGHVNVLIGNHEIELFTE